MPLDLIGGAGVCDVQLQLSILPSDHLKGSNSFSQCHTFWWNFQPIYHHVLFEPQIKKIVFSAEMMMTKWLVTIVLIVYLILPSCDISEASGTQSLLQLPGSTALLLLQGNSIHGLLSCSYTQYNK